MMKKLSHKSGFTLVETLVAIGILVIAILGSFSAVQFGLSTSTYAKNQVVAFYLAQEAVEQIRNLRDQNALNPVPNNWLTGIADNGDPCAPGNVCKVDVTNSGGGGVLSVCPNGICPNMTQNGAGAYGYFAGGSTTIFNRQVQITPINTHEALLTVTVTWNKGVLPQSFSVSEDLLDWE